MALKADRQVDAYEIGFYINEVATRGTIASVSTAGSGVAMDNISNVATIAATASGKKPLGMLLQEFVNVDLTRYPINWHRDQANSGSKATLASKGWLVTDQVAGNPNVGDYAVLYDAGKVSGIALGTATYNEAANPKVGHFRSKVDQNGFAKVYIDL